MKSMNPTRRAWILGGGAAVLLLIMLVAPQFAPKASPGNLPDEPSISTTDTSSGATADGSASNTNTTSNGNGTGAEGLTGRPASNEAITVDEREAPSLLSFGVLLRVGLVGVVLVVAVVGLRWWNKRAAGPRSTSGFIKVIDTLPIQGGRAIHLVEVGDRVLAVGATAQQLSLITELTDEEAFDLRDRIQTPAEPQLGALAQQLMRNLRRDDGQAQATNRHLVIGEDA